MTIVHLNASALVTNCSRINWCYPHELFANDIQKLISKYDLKSIDCGKHSYKFNLLPSGTFSAKAFSFNETNMLMQLIPGESDHFYLKAAIREYVNTFNVFNCKGERVYPEDIV